MCNISTLHCTCREWSHLKVLIALWSKILGAHTFLIIPPEPVGILQRSFFQLVEHIKAHIIALETLRNSFPLWRCCISRKTKKWPTLTATYQKVYAAVIIIFLLVIEQHQVCTWYKFKKYIFFLSREKSVFVYPIFEKMTNSQACRTSVK
jgi:hypothetical protein